MEHFKLDIKQLGGVFTYSVDYKQVTGSYLFSKTFCFLRWVCNVSLSQRALQIYDKIELYVENTKLPSNYIKGNVI